MSSAWRRSLKLQAKLSGYTRVPNPFKLRVAQWFPLASGEMSQCSLRGSVRDAGRRYSAGVAQQDMRALAA